MLIFEREARMCNVSCRFSFLGIDYTHLSKVLSGQPTGIGFQVLDQLSLHPLYLSFAFFPLLFLSLSFLFPFLPSFFSFCPFVFVYKKAKERGRKHF